VEGPTIRDLPLGFVYDANASSSRKVLPERELLDTAAWMTLTEDRECSITFTTYAGPSNREQATAARDDAASKYPYAEYGDVRATSIDGRPAWAWFTTQTVKGELASRTYTAVIADPEEDVTYTVEFHARDPRYRTEAFLMETVDRFTVHTAGAGSTPIVLGALLAGGFALALRRMGRR
jgi:hypothetical protein